MKKIIKVIFISLFIILVLLSAGIIIFLKTFDFNRLKPQIIAAGQNTLGRSLDFAKLDLKLSFKNGAQLRLTDISVGEHPDFGKGRFLEAKEAYLGVSLKDLLLKRQISVLGVKCESPRISIVRLKDGRINVQAFGAAGQSAAQAGESSTQKLSSTNAQPPAVALPVILVNQIKVDNGRLEYIDYSFEPKLALVFEKMMLKAENFSLADSFPITLQGSFASGSPNIFAQGNGQINMNRLSFVLKDVKANSDLSTLSMDTLRSYIPQLEGVPLPEIKSGALTVALDLFEAGQEGLMALKGQGTLSKGSLKMKELVAPIEPIEANFSFSESDVTINNASFSLGRGKVEFSGCLNDYMFKQEYSFKVTLKEIDLNECIDQSAYSIKAKGLISGNFEFEGQGFDPNTALSKLSGSGSTEIKEGQLTDINVLKMVLDKLTFIPNLSPALEAGLPENIKNNLRKKDTVVTSLKTKIELRDGKVAIQPINMEAEYFNFQGSGKAGLDQAYFLNGSFIIPQELSAKMTAAVPQLEYLTDEKKQIRFPLKVSGKGASVSFMPDVKQISSLAIQQKGRQELEKVLDKVLGKEAGNAASQTNFVSPGQDQSGSDKATTKKQIIDTVIGTIFKEPPQE